MATFKNEKALEIKKEEQELSDSDDEELEVLPTKEEQHGPTGKALTFNHTDSFQLSRDMIIQDGETPIYYADVSEFSRNKPDITLHRGGRDGPVVAASWYGFSKKIRLGVGSDDISMVWTELKRGGHLMSKRYAFEWNGKPYLLQRATSKDTKVTGLSKLMLTHFKVVDVESGELVALYVSHKIGKKKGTMKFKPGLPEELEILFVLGVASWRDKIRREQPKGGGGG